MSVKSSITMIKQTQADKHLNSRQSFTNRSCFEESKISFDENSKGFKNSKVIKLQTSSKLKNPPATSRRKISAIFSPRSPRRFNISMYSNHNTNRSSKSTRSRFFSISTASASTSAYPLTPVQAIETFKDFLSEYELSEIFSYKEIWFYPPAIKKPKLDILQNNSGFDNSKGDYKVFIGDHIAYRYQILTVIGTGSFGQVCKCLDHKTKDLVAVKIIKNKKKFNKQGLVESNLLTTLQDQDPNDIKNIVRTKGHFIFRSHICIVFELLSINLYELIKINSFQKLSLNLVYRFAVQILTALEFSASLGIIHCDLKPENILLKNLQKSGIKIIDFGSGCFENERIYTYIQSRFYRAPEIMLGIPYTTKIDMWSFGCILAELHTGRPLFPGENETEQFCRIMEVVGRPPDELLQVSLRKKVFFDSSGNPRLVLNSRGKPRIPGSRDLADILETDDLNFVSFVLRLLDWVPESRMSAEEALKHPWLTKSQQIEKGKIKRGPKTFIEIDCI